MLFVESVPEMVTASPGSAEIVGLSVMLVCVVESVTSAIVVVKVFDGAWREGSVWTREILTVALDLVEKICTADISEGKVMVRFAVGDVAMIPYEANMAAGIAASRAVMMMFFIG